MAGYMPTAQQKSTAQAPERSLDQRMEALRRANEIRSLRARLKRELKSGQASIASVIAEPPDFVLTAKVFDMLVAVPKYGKVKATRSLNTCRISQGKTIGGLSERQRAELLDVLSR
jgi:hypothetical protein